MSYKIIPVRDQQLFQEYLQYPSTLYRQLQAGQFYDSPALYSPAQNPVMQHITYQCFIALDDNQRPAGRLAAIVDHLNPDEETGFFGCFECQDDAEIAAGLISAAADWLGQKGCKYMLGPATFNTNQKVGVLAEGFGEGPQHMMPFNPPYYAELLSSAGMTRLTDLLSFTWHSHQGMPPGVALKAQEARQLPGVSLRYINPAQLINEAALIREVFNGSMAKNWGFIPMTQAESVSALRYCAIYSDPNLLMAVTVHGKPAGILLFMPAPVQAGNNKASIRAAIMGVLPEFRHQGLDSLMMETAVINLIKLGYSSADLSQVHENNHVMIKKIETLFEAQVSRRFAIFRLEL